MSGMEVETFPTKCRGEGASCYETALPLFQRFATISDEKSTYRYESGAGKRIGDLALIEPTSDDKGIYRFESKHFDHYLGR